MAPTITTGLPQLTVRSTTVSNIRRQQNPRIKAVSSNVSVPCVTTRPSVTESAEQRMSFAAFAICSWMVEFCYQLGVALSGPQGLSFLNKRLSLGS